MPLISSHCQRVRSLLVYVDVYVCMVATAAFVELLISLAYAILVVAKPALMSWLLVQLHDRQSQSCYQLAGVFACRNAACSFLDVTGATNLHDGFMLCGEWKAYLHHDAS